MGKFSEKFDVFAINDHLDRASIPHGVNENFIRTLLSILDQIDDKSSPEYWLIVARLAETTLLCAGYYADTIGFLNSWQINSLQDLHIKLKNASPETRKLVRENLCNFDRTIFNRMGDDINRMQSEPCYHSEFLKADSFMDS